jgi:uncharacterized membrane protein SpoIIM required for sporulation
MRQELFEARYTERWQAFEATLAAGRTRSKRDTLAEASVEPLPPDEFPRRYREICHHLALSRDRHYSTALVGRLEQLALAGHQRLYGAQGLGGSVREFLFHGFPALVRRRIAYLAASTLLFFGPLLACLIVIQYFPDFAHVVMPSGQLDDAQQMYAPGNARLGLQRGADSDFVMFGFYVSNNVRIDFQCFAGGMLFGIGAVFFLLFNGLSIGTIAGHLTHMGYIETFWSFVAGHSAFELAGVVLSGAAGLMVGMALIAPGRRGRFAALKAKMPDIIGLVYGASLLTFLAAFIEAFWSASRLPPVEIKYAVGIALWVITLSYLGLTGRARKGWTDAS